jgi:hypothetical protein
MYKLIGLIFTVTLVGCNSISSSTDELAKAAYNLGCINGTLHIIQNYTYLTMKQRLEMINYCNDSRKEVLK